MSVEFLIDGYNLLYNAGLGRGDFAPREFERARNRLLKRLQTSLTPEERARASIVFDAQYAEHSDRRPLNLFGMTVLFSPRGRQADDLIEILLAAHPHPRQVVVISSDHRLQRAARSVHAGSLSSDEFLVELDERKLTGTKNADAEPRSVSVSEKPQEARGEDVEEWLAEFGDIDVGALVREIQSEIHPVSPARVPSPPLPPPGGEEKPDIVSPGPDSSSEAQRHVPTDDLSAWLKDVIPLRSKPVSRPPDAPRGGRKNYPPSSASLVDESESSRDPALSAELNFWQLRVEEMLREEEGGPQ